jgi:hypothetical protein
MTMSRTILQSLRPVAALAACLVSALALEAPAQPVPPASPPADGATLDVVVLEVKGTVQASTDDGKTWSPAKTGLHLPQGASFRTGFRSSVTCGIAPDQGFTLESLGTVRVEEAIKKGKRFKTDLVMKYGATNYSIETGGVEHETTIHTPGSTLAVRGTVVRVTDRPGFAPTAESFTGRAVFKTARGTTTVGRKGGGYARVSESLGDASLTALGSTVVDPAVAQALTATDAQLIAQQTSLGAVATFDTRANVPVITNGPPPLSDAELVKSLPGPLDFVLRWTGNANLDLEVSETDINSTYAAIGRKFISGGSGFSQATVAQIGIENSPNSQQVSETLFSSGYGLNTDASGGHIPYDNRGGPNGGMEIAYWQGTPPQGVFGIGAYSLLGGAPAHYTLNAYLDGSPLYIFYKPSPGASDLKTLALSGTLTSPFNSGNTIGAQVFSPPNSLLNNRAPTAAAGAPFNGERSKITPAVVEPVGNSIHSKPASAAAIAVTPMVPAVAEPIGRGR